MITPPNGDRLTFFNVANTYAQQLKQNPHIQDLCPVMVVRLVNGFLMFPDKKRFKSVHQLCNSDTNSETEVKSLNMTVIELKKFNKREDELLTNEDRWLFFLKEIDTYEVIPQALLQEDFVQACSVIERRAWDDDGRELWERAFIKQTDEVGMIAAAVWGNNKALTATSSEKDINRTLRMALLMLSMGIPANLVTSLTNLNMAVIEDLEKIMMLPSGVMLQRQ